jgi:hypothetical protein
MKTIQLAGTLTGIGRDTVTITVGGGSRGMAKSFDLPANHDEQRDMAAALHLPHAIMISVEVRPLNEPSPAKADKIRLDMGDIYIHGPAHRTEKLVEFIAKTIAAALNVKPPTGAA